MALSLPIEKSISYTRSRLRKLLIICSLLALLLLVIRSMIPEFEGRYKRYKPKPDTEYVPVEDNFPLAALARSPDDLPSVPEWNKPKNVSDPTPLFIGFTRNWMLLQQAVVSYITAGWPPEWIYVIDNSGVMDSNKDRLLSLQNPFYLDHQRLTDIFQVNVITLPTLFTFSQLQNYYLWTAKQNGWAYFFWSHMDVLVLSAEQNEPYRSVYDGAVEELSKSKGTKFGTKLFAYDRLALVNVKAYLEVGGWDHMIPYYGADCDMYQRLAMAGYKNYDAFIGHIDDVGTYMPDLQRLYRQDDDASRELCVNNTSPEKLEYGINDCRFEWLFENGIEMQTLKNIGQKERNTWHERQEGGEGEPFYVDSMGFTQSWNLVSDAGRYVMAEKWGHRGCALMRWGLNLTDPWKVRRDWEW